MRPTTTASHQPTLRDYLQVVRRRKWVIVLAVLLVPLAALAFSLHQQAQYEGSSQVLLSQQDLAAQLSGVQTSNVDPADRLAQTQASLARVPAVAQGALDTLHSPLSVDAFLAASSVTPGTNSDLLTFTVTNHVPGVAQELAAAYARSYVRYRIASDTAPIENALREVQAQIAQLTSHGPLYTSLEEKATQLRTLAALKTANASVVQTSGQAVQTTPKTTRNVILGVILGLFLGIGLAFLRESLDTRVRGADEIGHGLGGLPLLGRAPAPPKRLRDANQLVMLMEPNGPEAEAFRMLRTNLDFVNLGRDARTLMITSAVEQEGKSTTIANLALALARSGKRVALVDLDLRRPFLAHFFGLGGPGITQVALGHVSLAEALVSVAITEPGAAGADGMGNGKAHRTVKGLLEVLPAGPMPPDPGEFAGTQALGEILAALRERCDLVLIDAPPVLHVGDAIALSAKVDGILVATRLKVVRRNMLHELARQLATVPTPVLGFVVTGADEESAYGYGYGYGYHARAYEPTEKARSGSRS